MSDKDTVVAEAPPSNRTPRWLLLGIGWLCVGLGFVGVFVPGMPTTPLLLIAAWCFYRSSEKAHAWLLGHRLLGPFVRDFLSGKGIPLRSKRIVLTTIWVMCGSSVTFFIDPVWAKMLVLLCAVIGTAVILRVPTRRSDSEEMRVAIIEHAPFERAAAIGEWARARGHEVRRVDAIVGEFPAPGEYDFLVVMGGPMSANDDASLGWLAAEKRAVREGIDAGKRVLGVCLGAQIVASVLGATVARNAEPEIGWFPVTLTPAGRASRVFGALPESFVAGHWHGETFGIPDGAVATATSEACANQAFEFDGGRVLGVQFHLEWLAEDAESLVENCGADLVPSSHVVNAEEFLEGERVHGEQCRAILNSLLDAAALFR